MQPDLDLRVVECRADLVHVGPPGRRGAGVIVGIVESGIDFTIPRSGARTEAAGSSSSGRRG